MNPATRVLALAATLLAACAELPQAPEGGFEFELNARFAARYRDEAASGLLAWRHRAASDEVLLSSSFGQGLARISREGEKVTLLAGDDRRYSAADAETLTEQVLGFRLPLRGLADWVRARPAAGAPAQPVYAQDGRLQSLEQHGWRIEYLGYDGARPVRLKLNYPGLELRLAIGEWK
ncbi:MAG TPA: lipoprotein insertase outer membrane protein LolB [Burkholderiales bacterium]|nr:lipoprotein insertase outer membrane protein LolB [Burkholderiales bacterium]